MFTQQTLTLFAKACGTPHFLGLNTWYRYVPHNKNDYYGNCKITINGITNAYWLIALGILDILLRIAGMIAIGYIIAGGFRYITSQGNPENTSDARRTITNALIGLLVVVVSIALVAYIARNILV